MSDWDMDGAQNHWNADEDFIENEANVGPDELEWMQQFAEDHLVNDEGDEGLDQWIETDTMSSDDTYDWSGDGEEQAFSLDPLVPLLDQPHPSIPPRRTRFQGQPLPHTSVRGAACPLRPGVASFPAASISQHYQTADALAIIPPPSHPPQFSPTSSSTHSEKPQADAHAPIEAVVGDNRRLVVVRIRQGAVSQQLEEHAPRLKAAVQLAYSNTDGVAGAGTSAAGAAPHSTAQHSAPGEPRSRQAAATPAAAPAAASSMQGPDAQAGASSEPASTKKGDDDLGFEVLCDAHLGECEHYSITASPDGRFVATCGSSGLILLFAYIRGSAAADGPKAKLLQLAVFSTNPVSRNGHMINCVRFGQFAGEMRLLVTGQDRRVIFFNLPKWPANGDMETVGDSGQRISVAEKELSCMTAHELLVRDLRPWAELASPARAHHHHNLRSRRQEPKTQHLEVALQSVFIMQQAGSSIASPQPVQTQGIKGFPKPPNCCEPSPDGRWLVVSVDQPRLMLIPACTEYWRRPSVILELPSPKSKAVGALVEPKQQQAQRQAQQQQQQQQGEGRDHQEHKSESLPEGPQEPHGLSRAYEELFYFDRMLPQACQYCRFSPDAQYLAATSDSMQSLFVWSIPGAAQEGAQAAVSHPAHTSQPPSTDHGPSTSEAQPSLPSSGQPQLLFVMRARKPLMALSWCPWDQNLLVTAQDRWRFMMLDVRNPGASLSRITLPRYPRLPPGTSPAYSLFAPPKEPRINGLALTPDGKILLATPSILFVAQAITQWDGALAASRVLPPAFYAAARTLLLGAHQKPHQHHRQPRRSVAQSGTGVFVGSEERAPPQQQSTPSAGGSDHSQTPPAAAGSHHSQPVPGAECLLHVLPPDVVELIAAKAAFPLWEWAPMLQTLPVIKNPGESEAGFPFWRTPLLSEDLNDWEEVPSGSQRGEQRQQQQRRQQAGQLQHRSEQQQQQGEPMQVDVQRSSGPVQGGQQHLQHQHQHQKRVPLTELPPHVLVAMHKPQPQGPQPLHPPPNISHPRFIPASILRVVHAQDVLHPRLFLREQARQALADVSGSDDLSDDEFRESSDFSMGESGSESGSSSDGFSTPAGSQGDEGADFAAGWGEDEPPQS